MRFFRKFPSLPFKKDRPFSWGVILKGAPDKRAEEALVRLFTEKLDVPGDDALKIVHAVPILLFEERSAREAEEIKLILNETGARTAISNDPHEFKRLPRVVWPKKIETADLTGKAPPSSSPPAPPPSKPGKPVVPIPSKAPAPPPAPEKPAPPPLPSEEWRTKYDNLQKSYLETIDRLEKKELELQMAQERVKRLEQQVSHLASQLETFQKEGLTQETVSELGQQLKGLSEERDQAVTEREEAQRRIEALERELAALQNLQSILEKEKEEALRAHEEAEKMLAALQTEVLQSREEREGLQKEINFLRSEMNLLRSERDKPLLELEKARSQIDAQLQAILKQREELESQQKLLGKLIEMMRGEAREAKPTISPKATLPPLKPAPFKPSPLKPGPGPVIPTKPIVPPPPSGKTGKSPIDIIPPPPSPE